MNCEPNTDARAVDHAATILDRTHPHAPPLDVPDLVMRGRAGKVLGISESNEQDCNLAGPVAPVVQPVVAAFDEAMTPAERRAFTSAAADAGLREESLHVWRVYIAPRFEARCGVVVSQS